MKKSIGIILESLEISQIAFEVINTINHEILSGSNYNYNIFFENLSVQCVNPLCSIMNINEIWSFSGILIGTSFSTIELILKLKTDILPIFYIWDMEWLRDRKDYLYNLLILRNPNLVLVSRSQDAANELEKYSNRNPNIIMSKLSLQGLANASIR